MLRQAALAVSLTLAFAACTADTASQVGEATSCEGASYDANDRCRLPNGRFAKSVCCEVPQVLTERRSLESYTCPADGEDVKVAFFDADSTLRISRSGTPTASNPEDVYVLPFVAPTLVSPPIPSSAADVK